MAFLGFVIYVVGTICAGILARDRYRSAIFWVLLSIIVTPIATVPILLCLGDKEPLTLHHIDRRRRIGFVILGILIALLYAIHYHPPH